MKYFTPELFAACNSPDEDEVDAAASRWEKASDRYVRQLKRIEANLPVALREFSRKVCLHDAAVIPWQTSFTDAMPLMVLHVSQSRSPKSVCPLAVRQDRKLTTLFYADLLEDPMVDYPYASEVFYDENLIWLYDEIHVPKRGQFRHEVFLSNGRVLRFSFRHFHYTVSPTIDLYADNPIEKAVV